MSRQVFRQCLGEGVGVSSAFVTLLVEKHFETTTTHLPGRKQNQPHWLRPMAESLQVLRYKEQLYSPEIASSIFLLAPKVVIPSSFRS